MKIGILTYHRSHNYGAQLQGIALRQVLASMGHEATFVNYWPYYHYEMYALFPPKKMLRNLVHLHAKYLINLFRWFPWRYRRACSLWRFMRLYSRPYWEKYDGRTEYDAIVYGSDQIWRKQGDLGGRFNPVYFGQNKLRTRRHVAYAASMGRLDVDDADKAYLRSSLSRFAAVSVRESGLARLLDEVGIRSQVVLDPTLLLNAQDWEHLLPLGERPIREKYVLFYEIMGKSFDEGAIKAFAAKRGLRYYKLCGGVGKRSADRIDTVGPEVFVSLVKHAEIVFTSSYHGLVFSLQFRKPFYASYSQNAGRAESLLHDLCLEHCLLPPLGEIPDCFPDIDYDQATERLQTLKQDSLIFLSQQFHADNK